MKRIYNKDIKAMKLTEDEMWWAKILLMTLTKMVLIIVLDIIYAQTIMT